MARSSASFHWNLIAAIDMHKRKDYGDLEVKLRRLDGEHSGIDDEHAVFGAMASPPMFWLDPRPFRLRLSLRYRLDQVQGEIGWWRGRIDFASIASVEEKVSSGIASASSDRHDMDATEVKHVKQGGGKFVASFLLLPHASCFSIMGTERPLIHAASDAFARSSRAKNASIFSAGHCHPIEECKRRRL